MSLLRLYLRPVEAEVLFSVRVMLTCHDESETPIQLAYYVLDRYLYIVKFERGTTFEAVSPQTPNVSSW